MHWRLQFQHKSSEASDDPTSSLLFAGDDEERYILFPKFELIVMMLILTWGCFLFVDLSLLTYFFLWRFEVIVVINSVLKFLSFFIYLYFQIHFDYRFL